MKKIIALCLLVGSMYAFMEHQPKTKEQKEGYRYGQTMRILGMGKWECDRKFKNIDNEKLEWCEYGWVDKSEEIDARDKD